MKKIVSLVIAVMMLSGMVVCAQAAGSPTMPSPGVTFPMIGENGVTVDDSFVLEQDEITPEAEAMQAELIAVASAGTLAEYFGEAAEGIDLTTAQLDEFIPMNIAGYNFIYGDVKATIECLTEYTAEDKLVAMLGSVNGETITWYPLEAEVDENGSVVVTFTEEVLLAVTDTEVVLAVLRIA